jgi:hypothetical protein
MSLEVKITSADDFGKYRNAYLVFLKKIAQTKSPAFANMGTNPPAGFLYLVDNLKRWTTNSGQIALLFDTQEDSMVGICAVENCYISNELSSGGNRCWLLPKYRQNNEMSKYLLRADMDWSVKSNKAGMLLTFNNYNVWIYNTIVKLSTNSGSTLGTVWSDWWDDCIALPRKIRLHNTPQWAVIKPFDKSRCIELSSELDKKYGVRNTPFIRKEKDVVNN